MKRYWKIVMAIWFCLAPISVAAVDSMTEAGIAQQAGYDVPEDYIPKGGTIVFELETGQILFERNADIAWNAASLSKVMTLYLAYEAIEKGTLSRDHVFTVTEKYVDISQNYSLSNNQMILGAEYTFDELVQLIVVPSSNAACILLADTIAGDEAAFVEMMNAKAAELGMTQSRFYNSAGPRNEDLYPYIPEGQPLDGDNVISARDYAILAYHFLTKYPAILENTNQYFLTVKPGTVYEESFTGYQHSLPDGPLAYEGTDGLKTGSSDTAGYNIVSTAKRGNTRLVMVMLGVGSWPDDEAELARNKMNNAIYDQLFARYAYQPILSKGKHEVAGKSIELDQDFYGLVVDSQQPELVLEAGTVKVVPSLPVLSGAQTKTVAYREPVSPMLSPSDTSPKDLLTKWLTGKKEWWLVIVAGIIAALVFLTVLLRPRRSSMSKRRAASRID